MTFGGCYIRSDESIENMALKSVQIEGKQQGLITNFEIIQTFFHSKPESQQISYIFPNDMKICIYNVTFLVGDEIIQPKIKSKDEAKKIYEEAVEKGETAIYGSNVRHGLSEIKLGNLPPNVECKVILKVALLCQITKSNTFFIKLPLDVYTPSGSMRCLDVKASQFNFKLQCDRENVTKVTSNVTNYKYDDSTKLFTINDKIENNQNEKSIIITFEVNGHLTSSALIDSTTNTSCLVTISPPPPPPVDQINSEFVFIVDCSGSMSGSEIKKAADCMEVFVRSLPLKSRYNIIRFGSSYEKLFESSVEFNSETMEKGLKLISELDADLGGTELYPPLEDLFNCKCESGLRQVFIITDGEVWSPERLIELIGKNSSENRCFTIGIGGGCDAGLVEGIAKASGGKCDFVQEGDSISEKVIPQLQCSLMPMFTDVQIHVEGKEAFEVTPFPIPNIPANGVGAVIFHCQKDQLNGSEGVLVTAAFGDNQIDIPIDRIEKAESCTEDKFGCSGGRNVSAAIFPLFAFSLIQSAENKTSLSDAEKAKIIDLSIQSGVLSKHTGYVGVLETVETCQEEEEVEMAGGFDDLFGDGGGGCSYTRSETVKYAKIISDSDDGCCREEEEVEMAGGFDDLFDGGGGGYCGSSNYKEEKAENNRFENRYSLMNLIKLQKFDGYWEDLAKINEMLEMNIQKVEGIDLANKDLERMCIATVLAVAALHVRSQNEENTWSMIAQKAVSWLRSNLPGADIDKIIEETEKLIKI